MGNELQKYYGEDLGLTSEDFRSWYRITNPQSALVKSGNKGESTKDYFLFCLFAMQPPPIRRLTEVARLVEEQTGKEVSLEAIRTLFNRFSWQLRAEMYDDYIAEMQRTKHEQTVMEMNNRNALIARDMVSTLLTPFRALVKKSQSDDFMKEIEALNSPELLRMLDKFSKSITELMKMERLSMGVSTTNKAEQSKKEVNVNFKLEDFTRKLDEEEEKLNKERK